MPTPTPNLAQVEIDRKALTELYHTAGGRHWKNNWSWTTDRPLDSWTGVTTDRHGRVTKLDLSGNGLEGTIPSSLGNLSNLKELNLSGNKLTGSIPAELGNLRNLETFELGYNDLTGSIPPQLGNFSNLRQMDLNENQLTGTVPPELGDLESLAILNLQCNNLTGPLPDSLEVWPESHWPGFGLRQADVFQSYTAW